MRVKEQRKAEPREFSRKIHFGSDEVWTYRVSSMLLLVREPNAGRLHRVLLFNVTGMTFDEMARGIWKRWWRGVGPGEVRAYIEGHLRGQEGVPVPERVFVEERLLDRVSPSDVSSQGWSPSLFERQWHTTAQCHLAFRGREVPATAAASAIGAPITRATLCGACRMRERHS